MMSNFIKKAFSFLVFFSLLCFCRNSLFCQGEKFNKLELSGEWQNSSKFVTFDFEQQKIKHELKTFYGLWRGKIHTTSFSDLTVNPLVFENQLFMEYWILDNYKNPDKNSKIKLYLPESNIYEISLDKPFVKSEIYGYLILGSLENVVKIRYWNCDLELTEDVIENQKACITEKTVEINSKKNFLDFENLNDEYFRNIKKYIKIDDKIYTCVEGRGTKIRNVEKIDLKKEFPNLHFFEKKRDSFLVLDSPYLFFLEKTEKDLQ